MSAQRLAALRIIRSYNTISDEAALMLARTPPGDLLATERARISSMKTAGDQSSTDSIKCLCRNATIIDWQSKWDSGKKGAWTRRLLPDLSRWYNARVIPTFEMTQFLTNHGCFNKYLTYLNAQTLLLFRDDDHEAVNVTCGVP